jgi:dihydrofolate reductase
MSKVMCGMAMSLDGFVAGPNQSEEKPFGDISENLLHEWMFKPGEAEKHKEEIDYLVDAGAFIMGRNMFGPSGEKYEQTWKGWWGPNPPYHAPVFVLTHIPRESFEMEGGTIFHFVTDGPESAFRQAKEVAMDKNILIAGGANVVNQFLKAGIIDELWLHIAPVTIGAGARLFEGVSNLRLKPIKLGGTEMVTHIKYQVLK